MSNSTDVKMIPKSVLFGNPVNLIPRISPDGTKLAYLAPFEGVLNVWIRTMGETNDQVITQDKHRGIYMYFWTKDSKQVLYLQDIGGNENFQLFLVDLETNETQNVTPFEDVQVGILAYDKHFPNDLLLTMNKEDPKLYDVYRLDLTSQTLQMVAKNPGNVRDWIVDTNLNVRGAHATCENGDVDLLIRESNHSEWEKILTWGLEDNRSSRLVSFTADGNSIYLKDSRNANATRLVKMNLETKETELLIEDPQYDVGSILRNPDTYEVEAVTYEKARQEWIILDESLKPDFEIIRELDRGDFQIINRDHENQIWVIQFLKDNEPITYYTFNRKTKTSTFLFYHQPAWNDYTFAEKEPIVFQARDGLTIHGYITFPPNTKRKNLPMVLDVHGGPWARNFSGYDPVVQWIANRGYICLQVNFRGSTGYGKEFLNAGDREWAGKMHDDLIDAVNWAVENGYADPQKIAIYGVSYGGYAALVGATFTPDLFCCAVDVVGPSNLITLIKTVPPYWSTMINTFYLRVGHPEKDEDFLKSRSPLFKVDQIKIPILIGQGANDPRVKQAESDQIVEAMKEKGLDYEYVVFEDEGHGFIRPENRMKFYTIAEEFLAKHLGGRVETATNI